MREEHTSKLLAVCCAVAVLLSLAFASVEEVSGADKVRPGQAVAVAGANVAGPTAKVAPLRQIPTTDIRKVPALTLTPSEIDTRVGVETAKWAPNVDVAIADGQFRFVSNGFPNHELPNPFLAQQHRGFAPPVEWSQFTDLDRTTPVVESPIDQTITLNPVLAAEPTETPAGLIGVLINGAQLFKDEADVSPRPLESYTDGFVDLCNGHPASVNADGTGAANYHYQGVPSCTTDGIDVEGHHSSIVGVLRDGFPVYGSNDIGGKAVTPVDLDECSGHFGPTPEFPNGIYHYHLLDEAGPNPIPCFRGEVHADGSAGDGAVDRTVRTRSGE